METNTQLDNYDVSIHRHTMWLQQLQDNCCTSINMGKGAEEAGYQTVFYFCKLYHPCVFASGRIDGKMLIVIISEQWNLGR